MITAEHLKNLSSYRARDINRALSISGYTKVKVKTARFVGLTNGGQFCYSVTVADDPELGRLPQGKVFLTYDPAADSVTVDY